MRLKESEKTASENNERLKAILENIRYAGELSENNNSVRIVIVISGSEQDRREWESLFAVSGKYLFNRDETTRVISLLERVGEKTREGNFLGTLLAYQNLERIAAKENIPYKDQVCMAGMIFGRGERISPFTQIEGDRKPAIRAGSMRTRDASHRIDLTAIEEALFYFVPAAKHIEGRGFRGILDKWGDETEIASIDLSRPDETTGDLKDVDVLKFTSNVEVTEDLAPQKDWVIADRDNNVLAIIPRNTREMIEARIASLGESGKESRGVFSGVSLGPVAVSYRFLDAALPVFEHEIEKDGIFLDFDPYLLMRLSFNGPKSEWEEILSQDAGYRELKKMIPDFFEKGDVLNEEFKRRFEKKIIYKSFDMGNDVYWADIGQHSAMREKFMLLNADSPGGMIAREIEGIGIERDTHGNIIIDSEISPRVGVKDSVLIGSTITGRGSIEGSVVKSSTLDSPVMKNAFSVLSTRLKGPLVLYEGSGIYRSYGSGPLTLEPYMRHGTLLLEDEILDLFVSEKTNLRDKEAAYDKPIFSNRISFRDAYDKMFGVSMDTLEARRKSCIAKSSGALR